jgi:hypothetical protein
MNGPGGRGHTLRESLEPYGPVDREARHDPPVPGPGATLADPAAGARAVTADTGARAAPGSASEPGSGAPGPRSRTGTRASARAGARAFRSVGDTGDLGFCPSSCHGL